MMRSMDPRTQTIKSCFLPFCFLQHFRSVHHTTHLFTSTMRIFTKFTAKLSFFTVFTYYYIVLVAVCGLEKYNIKLSLL